MSFFCGEEDSSTSATENILSPYRLLDGGTHRLVAVEHVCADASPCEPMLSTEASEASSAQRLCALVCCSEHPIGLPIKFANENVTDAEYAGASVRLIESIYHERILSF